jgi:hypothetical protein
MTMEQSQTKLIKQLSKAFSQFHSEQLSLAVKRGIALKKAKMETVFVTKQPLK